MFFLCSLPSWSRLPNFSVPLSLSHTHFYLFIPFILLFYLLLKSTKTWVFIPERAMHGAWRTRCILVDQLKINHRVQGQFKRFLPTGEDWLAAWATGSVTFRLQAVSLVGCDCDITYCVFGGRFAPMPSTLSPPSNSILLACDEDNKKKTKQKSLDQWVLCELWK